MDIFGILNGAIKQIRSSLKLLAGIYTPIILLFLVIGILSKIIPHFSFPEILTDVAVLGNLPFYSGAISQLGLLLWSAATALCFFTYFSLKKAEAPRKESLNFILSSGLLSGYLLLDDTYMLHEEFFPKYIKFLPEEVVLILLGIAMIAFLYFNRKEILRGEFSLMLLAFLFFGLSVVLDAIPGGIYESVYVLRKTEKLFEDGAKFTAIVTWVTFYARYGYQQLSQQIFQKNNFSPL